MRFKDKVALITAAANGIGRATAEIMAREGAVVVCIDNHPERLNAAVAALGERAHGRLCNALNQSHVDQVVDGTVREFGRIDILVNAVGGYAGGTNLWEVDPQIYDQMLQLNLRAGFALARAVVPAMIRRNRGWIVNIASKASVDHGAGGALYAASKAGALALFDSLAAEVSSHNINVNSVLPSIIDTAANRKAMPDADFSKWPKPEEIARVILFLCSEEARVIHGAAIPVYGKP
jgi:NAD(P)-dependent dehydrogenase (short-subunit alcohol dehydrogenase family)